MHKLRKILLAISSFFLMFSSKVFAIDLLNLNSTVQDAFSNDLYAQYFNDAFYDYNTAGCNNYNTSGVLDAMNNTITLPGQKEASGYHSTCKLSINRITYRMPDLCPNVDVGDYVLVNFGMRITGSADTLIYPMPYRGSTGYYGSEASYKSIYRFEPLQVDYSYNSPGSTYGQALYIVANPSQSNGTSCTLGLAAYGQSIYDIVNYSDSIDQIQFTYFAYPPIAITADQLDKFISTSGGGGGSSTVDLTTIEQYLSSVLSDTSSIDSKLTVIAGNQVTMNDNMVDYIENTRDVISSAISTQTSSINSQSVANTNAINQQIANSASSINSQISTTGQAISSGISTTNSNLSGISSQLNTIASNQVTANDNLLDYLDLIIANQQQSSGTIDYQYQQQTAQNTSSINQILTTDDMTTTEQAGLETVYSDLFDNLSFDSVMDMDGYADNPSQQKITDLAKNLYQSAIGIFGVNINSEALDFNSQTNLLYFIANSYNGPTWAKYFDFFNLSAYRIDGSRVNNSFSVKDTSSLVCKPLFVPLPKFALKWLNTSSIPYTNPSVSTTNLALYSNVSGYSVAPFGCSYDVEYKCYGFLIPCLYDIFPDFFFNGWGRAWMWVNAMSIILWLVYDLIHFVLDSLSLTIKPANDTVQFLNKGNK